MADGLSLKELDVIEGSAKGKELKEPKNKVKYSKNGDRGQWFRSGEGGITNATLAHALTLDGVNEVNESYNELPPSKRRAVGKENGSKKG